MNEKLSIGLLTPHCRGYNSLDGGIGSYFADLAIGLTALGHDVRVIIAGDELPPTTAWPVELSAARLVRCTTPMPHWLEPWVRRPWQFHTLSHLLHRSRHTRQTLNREHTRQPFDIIETTSSGLLAHAYVQKHRRAPVVTRISTTSGQLVTHNATRLGFWERIDHRLERNLTLRSDVILTHTAHHADELASLWQLDRTAINIVPLGIELPAASEVAAAARPETAPLVDVLYIGRFEHRKGIDVLLAALPHVLAAYPRARFTLIGQDSGDYWQQQFWREHPRLERTRVRFAGKVDAPTLRAAYRDCDVFVAPSRYESFGLIYVEAMAWAKPVVGCRAGGIPEVIADGVCGLLAEPGDPLSLEHALSRLVGDATLRRTQGLAARTRAEQLFSRETFARSSAALYRATAARCPRG